jgi:hypothetical protein
MPGPLSGPRKPHLNSKGGGGKGGEMTPTLYAHINKRKKKKLQGGGLLPSLACMQGNSSSYCIAYNTLNMLQI